MENNLITNTTLTETQIAGLILIAFGFLTVMLALHRKNLRQRINGLHKIVATDRAAFGKKNENLMQRIGIILLISGILTVTLSALVNHQPANQDTTQKVPHQINAYVKKA